MITKEAGITMSLKRSLLQLLLPGQKGRPNAADLAGEATIWGTSSALRHKSVDDITKAALLRPQTKMHLKSNSFL